jgi:hypothetical protein
MAEPTSKPARKKRSNAGVIVTEGGLIKTLSEATVCFRLGRTDATVSGPVYKDIHRILDDLRTRQDHTKSYNPQKGVEYGAALKALGEYLMAYPEALRERPAHLRPYTPRPRKEKSHD